MKTAARRRLFAASAFLAVALPFTSALAQGDRNLKQDVDDFVYYTMIAKPDLAEAHLRRVLDSGVTDAELADLIDSTVTRDKFQEALSRGRSVPDLTGIIAELETRYRDGDKARARNKDRIAAAIKDLGGTLRQQRMAKEILHEAGEFAVPQLLREVTDGSDARIRQECQIVIEQIGQRAVSALCAALLELDPQNQDRVAAMLGRIASPAAAPFLLEVASNEALPPATRESAGRSLQRVGGFSGTVADAYANLSRAVFLQPRSFTNYPTEVSNMVWSYDPFVGLVGTAVPTPIFGEVKSMQLARRALQSDPANGHALATFIAANLKRENDLPSGESDPIFGSSPYSAEFYATAAGPALASSVLGLAIETKDTVLVRDAIDALGKTAGTANLFASGGRQPIIESLQYPDRRVRYDAALTLARALPQNPFAGDYAIVPTLGSAVQSGSASYAAVIADEREDVNTYTTALNELGFTVVAQGATADEIDVQVAQSAGVDLIVIRGAAENVRSNITNLRSRTRTSVAPIVVMTTAVDEIQLRREFEDNPGVTVRVARDISAFPSVVDEALVRGSGGRLSEADAKIYAIESITALRDIAVSNSPIYNVADAEPALSDALATQEGSIRHNIASVLSYIDTQSAQRAVFDAALGAADHDQIILLGHAAASAKLHGNMVEDHHVAALLELVKRGGDVGEAAARVHGALNLSPDNVVKIIAD